MRLIATALLVLVAVQGAWAQEFDWQKAAKESYVAQADCRGTGVKELTELETQQACTRRDTLWLMLRMHNLCFEDGEQEWIPCKP